jgi:hypothetical protein
VGETPTLLEVGLTRRGPPTCRHRREWLRHGECAKGRVQPPGEPVKGGRTVETKGDAPTFLGLRVLTSFACALGESALPFMGSAGRGGSALPSFRILWRDSRFNLFLTPMATSRQGAVAQPNRLF